MPTVRAFRHLFSAVVVLAAVLVATPAQATSSSAGDGFVPGAYECGDVAEDRCLEFLAEAPNSIVRDAMEYLFDEALGVPYACDGAGREHDRYDCSSLVVRAYAAAGVDTRVDSISPWTGRMLTDTRTFTPVKQADLEPGDLVLYRTGPESNHVVMYLGRVDGRAWMAHTNICGGVARIEAFWGMGSTSGREFLQVVRPRY